MQRRIDDREIVCDLLHRIGIDALRQHIFEVDAVDLFADDADLACLYGFGIVILLHTVENVDRLDLCRDDVGMLRRQLCAVLPICLIAVVLLRIVRRGDVDARDAAEVANGERKLRRGANAVKNIDGDAVCREDRRSGLGKQRRIVAAVVCNDNAAAHCVRALEGDHLRHALRRLCNGVNIHLIEARAHRAAQTARAEFQIAEEAHLDLVMITCDRLQITAAVCVQLRLMQPALVILRVVHIVLLCCIFVSPVGSEVLPQRLGKLIGT